MNERDGWRPPPGRNGGHGDSGPSEPDRETSDPQSLRRRIMQHRRALARHDAALEVQLKAKSAESLESPEAEAIDDAADLGFRGESQPLPHLAKIQKSFGKHDVSRVAAHADGAAADAARSIGAEAFASGNHVAFDGPPSLHTAAHEATHVVQQRAGMQRTGGAGAADDAHERHADEVADRVVAGDSAESLLDRCDAEPHRERAAPKSAPVQRKIKIGTQLFVSGAPSLRGLRRDIMLRLAELGFPEKGTRKMWALLDQWLEAPGIAPAVFGDLDAMIGALHAAGTMEKKMPAGSPIGPRTLGDRPAWNNDNKTKERGESQALRHVISSSTMGAAIERCQADPPVLRAWLERHGLPLPKEKGPLAIVRAKQSIWAHVHNHGGNLWMGSSPENSAVGFIRSHLLKAMNNARRYMVDHECEQVPHARMTEWLPESFWKNNEEFQSTWNEVIASLKAIMQPDQNQQVDGTMFIEAALDCLRSCDLDLPPGQDENYFQKVNAVYAEIVGACGPDLFDKGGPLDQFLALSLEQPAAESKRDGGKQKDDASSDRKDDDNSAMDTSSSNAKSPSADSADMKDDDASYGQQQQGSQKKQRAQQPQGAQSATESFELLESNLEQVFDSYTAAQLKTGDGMDERFRDRRNRVWILEWSGQVGGELRFYFKRG